MDFEESCRPLIETLDWQKLEAHAVEQLDKTKGKSFSGFFYLGIALYKLGFTDQSIKSYQKAIELNPSDA